MELLLGTAQFDGLYGVFRQAKQSNPCDILAAAKIAGFTGVDTAPSYRSAETTIGECGWDGTIHTKISPESNPTTSLSNSLSSLKSKSVDALFFHDPSVLTQNAMFFRNVRQSIPAEVVPRIGVSIYGPAELERALEIPDISVIQLPLNLADGRYPRRLLVRARDRGISMYARSIFLQGALLRKPRELQAQLPSLGALVGKVRSLARRWHVSPLQVCLSWVRAQPGITGVVVGAERASQVFELAEAFEHSIEQLDELHEINDFQLVDQDALDPRRWDFR